MSNSSDTRASFFGVFRGKQTNSNRDLAFWVSTLEKKGEF